MRWLRFHQAGLALLCLVAGAPPARAQAEVDLALVIAVDVSASMDQDEQELQREGYAEAFRSPLVQAAIREGAIGRIAVAYMEWSGAADQWIVLPWTVLDNPEGILSFADRISHLALRRSSLTSISGALDRAASLFDSGSLKAARRVIDVSGDGPNNDGRAVETARDETVAKGIIINGLPIMLKQPGYDDLPDLDRYYRDCVIGGPGAFVEPARDRAQFQDAIKMKILREVSSAPDAAPRLVVPARSQMREQGPRREEPP